MTVLITLKILCRFVQVPLLLSLGEEERGLIKALDSGDTDLVYLALFHMYRTLTIADFISITAKRPAARRLFELYCRMQAGSFLPPRRSKCYMSPCMRASKYTKGRTETLSGMFIACKQQHAHLLSGKQPHFLNIVLNIQNSELLEQLYTTAGRSEGLAALRLEEAAKDCAQLLQSPPSAVSAAVKETCRLLNRSSELYAQVLRSIHRGRILP